MSELLLVEAVNDALHVEMERDENVLVLGEDVGRAGGVFRAGGLLPGGEGHYVTHTQLQVFQRGAGNHGARGAQRQGDEGPDALLPADVLCQAQQAEQPQRQPQQ